MPALLKKSLSSRQTERHGEEGKKNGGIKEMFRNIKCCLVGVTGETKGLSRRFAQSRAERERLQGCRK